jgi:predicted P-loop ATPase
MTQKLIIMDDEMGGKSKSESKRMKELTSKQTFSLREPYGRNNVDLERLALLCGTTNDNEILNDPTGNRRIIPINVINIDQEKYNSVDKIDVLMEAFCLYKSGFDYNLSREDVKRLNENTTYFEESASEYDLLKRFFERPEVQGPGGENKFLTTSDIKSIIEKSTQQKLSLKRLGMEMRRIGWIKTSKRIDGDPVSGYWVIQKMI